MDEKLKVLNTEYLPPQLAMSINPKQKSPRKLMDGILTK
jgi:hypothetical protein